jgi:hypothetical protein
MLMFYYMMGSVADTWHACWISILAISVLYDTLLCSNESHPNRVARMHASAPLPLLCRLAIQVVQLLRSKTRCVFALTLR